jgi:hypothetical protein
VFNAHPDITKRFVIYVAKYRFKIIIITTNKGISISSDVEPSVWSSTNLYAIPTTNNSFLAFFFFGATSISICLTEEQAKKPAADIYLLGRDTFSLRPHARIA